MITHRVSVRALAEFAFFGGDLIGGSFGAMWEGAKNHRQCQAEYPPGFEREVSLSLTVSLCSVELTVFGRADGVGLAPPVVEEIKSTSRDPRTIPVTDYPAYWAQAQIYAYMLSVKHSFDAVEVRLKYVNPAIGSREHSKTLDASELESRFIEMASRYCEWVVGLKQARDIVTPTMKALKFPYEYYRMGQREMAVTAYQAIRSRKNALIQAPTGIGKTMAALFAAIKAMGEGLTGRVFYLTARSTQRLAAAGALETLRNSGLKVRSVVITAKEKCCATPGEKCDPMVCPRAIGYYDRLPMAIKEALNVEKYEQPEIAALAEEYELCPFELSLDLSLTRDVIICDYNYAFDPKVKLKRFFTDKCDCTLLIDEAHNLIDRAREMFSSEIRQSDFRKLASHLKDANDFARPLYEAAKAVSKAMREIKKGLEYPRWSDEADENLLDAVETFVDVARPFLENGGEIADRFFEAGDFTRVAGEMNANYKVLLEPKQNDMSVKIWCFDPSEKLRKSYLKTRGAVLFSGTLSPIDYYAKSVGVDVEEGDSTLDLPSPFPNENLACVVVPVNTTFNMRQKTLDQVIGAIRSMCTARAGNYIACFPSYKYLGLAFERIKKAMPGMDVIAQQSGMTESDRESFLKRFVPSPKRSMLALIAMGGVFSEGVDLPGELLSGAAIVSVGMPGLSLERAALAASDEDDEGGGMLKAYTYPGIERVLQSAGRVIRSETDVGVVLLIDERFQNPLYRQLLPPYWKLSRGKDEATVSRILTRFWQSV